MAQPPLRKFAFEVGWGDADSGGSEESGHFELPDGEGLTFDLVFREVESLFVKATKGWCFPEDSPDNECVTFNIMEDERGLHKAYDFSEEDDDDEV